MFQEAIPSGPSLNPTALAPCKLSNGDGKAAIDEPLSRGPMGAPPLSICSRRAPQCLPLP